MSVGNVGVYSQYPYGNFNCDVKGIIPEKKEKSNIVADTICAGVGSGIACGGLYYLGEKSSVKELNRLLNNAIKRKENLKNYQIAWTEINKKTGVTEAVRYIFNQEGKTITAKVFPDARLNSFLKYKTTVGKAFKPNLKYLAGAGVIGATIGGLAYLGYRGIKALFTKNN